MSWAIVIDYINVSDFHPPTPQVIIIIVYVPIANQSVWGESNEFRSMVGHNKLLSLLLSMTVGP